MPPTDPRKLTDGESGSVADELLDRAIRHDTYLIRFSAGEAKRLVKVIERETLPDLRAQIAQRLAEIQARGYDTGPATTARLQATKVQMEQILAAALRKSHAVLTESLQGLAQHETTWQAKRLTEAMPIAWDVAVVPSATLRTLVSGMPVRGKVLTDWFGAMEKGIPERVVSELSLGIQEGQTVAQMARRIDPILDATSAGVEATVRSFVVGVSSQTREATFQENDDLIEGVRWVATLDHRTCIRCMALDGQVFPLNEGPRPIAHPNCRCGITPVLKDLNELARRAGFKVGTLPPRTRATLEGPMSDVPTAEAWLKKQPAVIQDDILGQTRGVAFRKGKGLALSDMIDALTGRPLTLDELAEREGIALN